MTDVPYYLQTRVRQALARAHAVARLKGLSDAFDIELFAADRAVLDLLGEPAAAADGRPEPGAGTPEGARAAQDVLARLDDLLVRLEAAQDRGPRGGDAPVGRAGRRPDRRR